MAELGYVVGALFVAALAVLVLVFVAAVLWLLYGLLRWVVRCSGYTFGACCAALERWSSRPEIDS